MAMYCCCCGSQPCYRSSSASAPRTFWWWKIEWGSKRTKSRFPKLGYIWYIVVWTLTMLETEFKKKED